MSSIKGQARKTAPRKTIAKKPVAKTVAKRKVRAKAKPVGRPTKYTTGYCDEIVRYFDVPLTYFTEETKRGKDGAEYVVKKEHVTDLPTFERFAHNIGVVVSTLWEWEQKYPEFSKACTRSKALQEHLIAANAMSGRYVGPFAQFYLKNRHAFSDRQEIDHTSKGEAINPYTQLSTEELRRLASGK